MVIITIFIINGMYLSFCNFQSYLGPSMYISGLGSFPAWSGGSLIYFVVLIGEGS